MGANVYLEAVASYGTIGTALSGTALTIEIPGRSGARIAIRSFGFMGGGTITSLYFMQVLGRTTLLADSAATLTNLNLTADPGPSGNSLATGDYICAVQDDGTYHFAKVGAITGLSVIALCTPVVGGSISAGQPVYNFGIYSDTGHIQYRLATTGAVAEETLDGGIYYSVGKGYPMRVFNLSNATGSEEFRWITVDYINK